MKSNSGALRYFGRIKNGTTPASGEVDYWDGDVLWATPEDLGKLNSDRISHTKRQVTEKAVTECNLFLLPAGSVIISTRAPIGHMAINKMPMAFNQGCRGIIPGDQVDGPFLYYLLKSRAPALNAIANGTTFVELSRDELAAVPVEFPPLDTQRQIARYLDEKTARVDGLIAKKQELLDRLAEKRQALITRAVTKGLNPDAPLEPSESGAREGGQRVAKGACGMNYFAQSNELPEWAAQVSNSWNNNWLKWSVELSTKRPTEKEDEALPYISNEHIASWTGKLLIEEPEPAEAGSRVFRENDVLFNKLRPYLAKVYHATFDGVSSGELLCLRPSQVVEPRFLFYVLLSKGFIDTVNSETFGAKMPRADWDIVGHQPLPLPSLDTQRRISRYLDEKTERIDGLIDKIEHSVGRLKEFRSAQITTAVTGQLTELS